MIGRKAWAGLEAGEVWDGAEPVRDSQSQTSGRGLARSGSGARSGGGVGSVVRRGRLPAASELSASPGCGLQVQVRLRWPLWCCYGCSDCHGPGAQRRLSVCTWAAAAGVSCASSAKPRGGTSCECSPGLIQGLGSRAGWCPRGSKRGSLQGRREDRGRGFGGWEAGFG